MAPVSFVSPTILVPVDFDDASRHAVATALEFARTFQGRLVLLHVVGPNQFPEGTRLLPVGENDPVDLGEYVSARARKLVVEHFAEALMSGVEVRTEVRTGHTVETILKAIGESEAKLVVVGTHGRRGVARMMLGSVAEAVLRRAPVPVIVVREPATQPAHDPTYIGAAAMTGAVAGAATGAMAGPVGVIAGGTLGTVVGALAGTVMDRENVRADARDRELDDTIGVTHGTIGTPAETKRPSREVLDEAKKRDLGAR